MGFFASLFRLFEQLPDEGLQLVLVGASLSFLLGIVKIFSILLAIRYDTEFRLPDWIVVVATILFFIGTGYCIAGIRLQSGTVWWVGAAASFINAVVWSFNILFRIGDIEVKARKY